MKVLVVTNPELSNRIHCYAKEVEDPMIEEVETAFEELDIHVEVDDVDNIATELEHGQNYWWNEKLCFEVINI